MIKLILTLNNVYANSNGHLPQTFRLRDSLLAQS